MDISNYWDLSYLLTGYNATISFEVEQHLRNQVLTEMSASSTKAQQNSLSKLADGARANIEFYGDTISVDVYFVNIPKGMEDYAEMLKSNALSIIRVDLRETIRDCLNFSDVREKIFTSCRQMIISELSSKLGGV